MANPFNLGLFKGPRYSAFPISHDNKISMSAGKITPIYWEFLNQGDKIEADVADVVRLAPMVVPTLDTYRVDIHAFALRLRSLGNANRNPWVYEDFFNLNKNTDGSYTMPMLPLGFLFSLNGFRTGTLLESLGIPTFKKDREAYLDFLRTKHPYVFDPIIHLTKINFTDDNVIGFYPSSLPASDTDGTSANVVYNDVNAGDFVGVYELGDSSFKLIYLDGGQPVATIPEFFPYSKTLVSYIASKYPNIFPFENVLVDTFGARKQNATYDFTDGVPQWISDLNGSNLLDKVYEVYKKDSVSVMKDFIDELLQGFLSLTSTGIANPVSPTEKLYGYDSASVFSYFKSILYSTYSDLPSSVVVDSTSDRMIPAYPFESYYKIISDWYINTAISDPDSFFGKHSFLDNMKLLDSDEMTPAACRSACIELNNLFKRFWSNDYFTSAFPSPQAGQAVGIPVNGTIVDLRNANAMQKLKERLLYAGSRFRDVMFAITGKKTSAAILEMSEVLGSWSNIINVDAVLQQSATLSDSPQAGYAGTGLGYRAGGKDFKYVAEEPTIIMVFASIVPQASYFQGVSRKLTRCNVYDYAVPQLANVGEQDIKYREIFVSLANPGVHNSSQIFGYTRRNGDFMWTPNEVHGDFQGSLDFWHNARIFGSMPRLSENFLQVNPSDDNLNRVFAVDSDSYDHFYCNFSFTGHVIRALPKHVHYDL